MARSARDGSSDDDGMQIVGSIDKAELLNHALFRRIEKRNPGGGQHHRRDQGCRRYASGVASSSNWLNRSSSVPIGFPGASALIRVAAAFPGPYSPALFPSGSMTSN